MGSAGLVMKRPGGRSGLFHSKISTSGKGRFWGKTSYPSSISFRTCAFLLLAITSSPLEPRPIPEYPAGPRGWNHCFIPPMLPGSFKPPIHPLLNPRMGKAIANGCYLRKILTNNAFPVLLFQHFFRKNLT